MESMETATPSVSRPYRSHKVPACDLCRHRKIRCNIDIQGQACRLCREKNLSCKFTLRNAQFQHQERSFKRRRTQQAAELLGVTRSAPNGLAQFPSIAGTSPDESSLILNPPMAEDVEALEHYLTTYGPGGESTAKPYSVIPSAPGKPIVYLTVPRHRKGLQSGNSTGAKNREIMEQILGQHKDDVIRLYFEKLHPCFPILDETTFQEVWQREPGRISSTLICDMYASALHFWDTSDQLKHYPRPELAFAWNLAVAALQEDFLGSTISTVHASLLDLIGRPVLSITGNIVTLGRTVTLAHSLGLHRDPSCWRATEHEKSMRIRLWWGVLIHDYWSSVAHGTPPLIHRQNYDVPLPTNPLDEPSQGASEHPASTFLHLCKLSRILGDLLPHVYALNPDSADVTRHVRRLECELDDWEAALPFDLRRSGSLSEDTCINGISNLHFCYLSSRLLLRRVSYKNTISHSIQSAVEARSYHLAMLREAASTLIEFVSGLQSPQLREFWLPYTAHLLVSATTILLRCLLEFTDIATKRSCAEKLVKLLHHLQNARRTADWDLADFCLERCSDPIEKIATAMGISLEPTSFPGLAQVDGATTSSHESHEFDPGSYSFDLPSNFFLPVDSLDYPFDALWDINR